VRDDTVVRIAALIIGVFAGILSLAQSCSLGFLGSLATSEEMSREAGWGLLMAFVAIFGAAFANGKPKVAT